MKQPRNWEEAFEDLATENRALRDALDNIVALWDIEASMSEIENSITRARALIGEEK